MHNIFDGNTMFKEISNDYIDLFYLYLEHFYNGYDKDKPIYR